MLKGSDGLRRVGSYTKRGEGGHQFSMAEGHPGKIRKAAGDVKNVESGQNAATQMGAQNILPSFEDAARKAAAKE